MGKHLWEAIGMAADNHASVQIPHNLVLEGRRKLSLTGIADVESFNEQEVVMAAGGCTVIVRGENLHMEKLSVDNGDVIITGRIDGVEYEEGAPGREGFFSRFFK